MSCEYTIVTANVKDDWAAVALSKGLNEGKTVVGAGLTTVVAAAVVSLVTAVGSIWTGVTGLFPGASGLMG